ncbi:hypothetical protein DL98DRAFT_661451 [Cadophora sp. DSE1049]|nr:hypothetical protein DL98DRAFT_661451 [Cadophora sp. DSE1049]
MAPRQAKRNIQKVGRQRSAPKGETQLQSITKEQPSRKSARLQRYQERTVSKNNTELKRPRPSPINNTPSKEIPQAEDRKRKRQRSKEDEGPLLTTPSQKRARTSPLRSPLKDTISENAAVGGSGKEINPIEYWRKEGTWPEEYFNPESSISHLLTKKKSLSSLRAKQWEAGSTTPSATTPSDQKPREAKSSGASTSSGRKSLVEDPYYRRNNLTENNIYLRPDYEEFPKDIAGLISRVRRDRDSPGPSSDQLRQDTDLYDLRMGSAEPAVENYFKANIFPNPKSSDSLKRIDKNPMAKRTVPDVGSKLKVSTPYPDMLYGYNSLGAFPQQQAQLRTMANEMVANTQDLIYPFFVIEFKADGPGESGSLWVATNQCLGGSASCVNITETLNRRLRQCKSKKIQPIDSATFSIAMSGTEARLYVSWKHTELDYYMKHVDSFLLQKPRDHIEFRKHALNIIDWGKDERLNTIRDSLDSLLEESRKAASQLAKSRPPPSSDDSARSSSQKRKSGMAPS